MGPTRQVGPENIPIIRKELAVSFPEFDPIGNSLTLWVTNKDFQRPEQFLPFDDTVEVLSPEAKFFINYKKLTTRLDEDPFFWREPRRPAVPFDNNWMY
jgi:hypothetical protein